MAPTLHHSDLSLLYAQHTFFIYFQEDKDSSGDYVIWESQLENNRWIKSKTPVAIDAREGTQIGSLYTFTHDISVMETHVFYTDKSGCLKEVVRKDTEPEWLPGKHMHIEMKINIQPNSAISTLPQGLAYPEIADGEPLYNPTAQFVFLTWPFGMQKGFQMLYRPIHKWKDWDINSYTRGDELSRHSKVSSYFRHGDIRLAAYSDKEIVGYTKGYNKLSWAMDTILISNTDEVRVLEKTPIANATHWNNTNQTIFVVTDGSIREYDIPSQNGVSAEKGVPLKPYYEGTNFAACREPTKTDNPDNMPIILAYRPKDTNGTIATLTWDTNGWHEGPLVTDG
ncbi:hypothetical protein BBP40_002788 [Aspergillus hancockii]|nr:hypothetical protein BBP40_002788 [Aspergillus hancockii]